MTHEWLRMYRLAGMLWPRHGGCYRRVSVWLSPDMRWLERPRPLDI
ncbi:hypothetical protein [Komagataeibacter sp. FNDCF1]|nr:hypothetical protein [Komagataeibacter sp. FNDCF1]MCE2565110.1 hypothetical protein [Komagataeibacter sp. FNDCF1]